jgi:uncharacterized membrane protein
LSSRRPCADGRARSRNRRLTESGRVEAFSDAVFAITITLLVLEIPRPALDDPELGRRLLERWPDYVAFAVSFVYVGVVWLNHHALFARIRNVDLGLNWINLLILATTALLPFPTGVLAGAFSEGASDSREAAVVLYAIVGALMSAAWIPVFPYLARRPDLLLDPKDAGCSPSRSHDRWWGWAATCWPRCSATASRRCSPSSCSSG